MGGPIGEGPRVKLRVERFFDLQFDPPDTEPIATCQSCALDALVVHVGTVRALEVDHFQVVLSRLEAAVQP